MLPRPQREPLDLSNGRLRDDYTAPRPVPSTTSSLHSSRDDGAFGPYLRAVRHHPWLVVLVTLVAVAVSVAWLTQRSHEYKATAQILVTPVSSDSTLSGLPILTDSVDPTRTVQTAATVLETPRTTAIAAHQLGGNWTVSRLQDDVDVQAQGDSNVVVVTATAPSAAGAAAAANAYARAALQARSESLGVQVNTQLANLQARRKALGTSDPTQSADLAGQISELQSIRDGRDPNFSLLQSATVPSSPSGTSPILIVVLAVLAGLVIGVGGALALEQVDRRLRDEDELLAAYPLPVLARIPLLRRRDADADHTALFASPIREAFRTLQVQLEGRGGDSRVVMLTSASVGDGKTTSAIHLAESLAASGCKVILLDLDLRKPDVGRRLGVSSDVLELFRSNVRLSDVLVTSPTVPSLRVLSATAHGDLAPVLEALSRRLPELLTQGRDIAEYVVIDTAPLGQVSDALRVAAAADDVLLVARPGNTNRRDLAQTRDLLERMGMTPTGMLVVGGTGGPRGTYYGYGRVERAEIEAPAPRSASVRRVREQPRRSRDGLDVLP